MSLLELRVYSIIPKNFANFLSLTNEHLARRTAHSPLLGYWATEIGGQNEVVHIWQYDSLAQRKGVREALVKDEVWMKQYMAEMRPLLAAQTNQLYFGKVNAEAFPKKGESFAYFLSGATTPTNATVKLEGLFKNSAPIATLFDPAQEAAGAGNTGRYLFGAADINKLQAAGNAFSEGKLLMPTAFSAKLSNLW